MKEVWRSVVDYEGFYKVSSKGRVRSLNRVVKNSRPGTTRIHKGKILKPGTINGYKHVILCANGKTKRESVHRLVANAFIKNDLGKPCINHKDRDRGNNCVENLEWCSYSENTRHYRKMDKWEQVGEKNNNAKLTNKSVLKIRRLNKDGESQKNIAKKFHVTRSTVSEIINKKRWDHI